MTHLLHFSLLLLFTAQPGTLDYAAPNIATGVECALLVAIISTALLLPARVSGSIVEFLWQIAGISV